MSYAPDSILADTWARLHAGQASAKHPFRTAALATADALGRPDVRTVVLRQVDAASRCLDFQTDRRSPKYFNLQHNGTAAWLFYDSDAQLQLRVQTSVTLHASDDVAQGEWDRVPARAREPYCQALAPGAEINGPEPTLPTTETDGRHHFVVGRCRIDTLEWLRLIDGTWRRLRFTWPAGQPTSQWLMP